MADETENESMEDDVDIFDEGEEFDEEELEQTKEKTKKDIKDESPGAGHEKPKAYPEKGTLNQETVDATIKTLKNIKEQVKTIEELLKFDELEKLIKSINSMNSTLTTISIKELNKSTDFSKSLSPEEIVAICESKELSKTINSKEMTDFKLSLQTLDITELQKSLLSILNYLQKSLPEFFTMSLNGIQGMCDSLDEIMKPFKALAFPMFKGELAEVVKQIIEYLMNLSKYLFDGPMQRIMFLVAWYSVYGSEVAKEIEEIQKELQKAIEKISKLSLKLGDPNLAKIPVFLLNISQIQEEQQKCLNNNAGLIDKINETIFKERAEMDKAEEELSKKDNNTNLPY